MFLANKYAGWYFNIIENRKIFSHDGYVEKHHIIPKSIGGSNETDNIVSLTAREHFICHRLLTKMLTGSAKLKMVRAVYALAHWRRKGNNIKVSSKTYQRLKEEFSIMVRESKLGVPRSPETRAKISASHIGMKASVETKARLSASHKGINTWSKGRKLSPEHIQNIAKASTGRIQSQEHIEKRLKAHIGALRSDETKQAISAALLGKTKGVLKPKVTCPHCGKEGGKPAMMRFHFDNCATLSYN